MYDLSSITSGMAISKKIFTVYGGEKVGKTTFACEAPDSIIIPVEQGSDHINVNARFPKPQTFDDILSCLTTLMSQEHPFKTVIIDSVDAAERLAQKQVCVENNIDSMEELGYGKAYKQADEKLLYLLEGLEVLRDRGIQIIIIGHSKIQNIHDPRMGDSYNKAEIDCRDTVASKLKYISDAILFADIDAPIQETQEGLKKTKSISTSGRRILCTELTKAYSAGNRLGLPPILDLKGKEFWAWIEANVYNNTNQQQETK